jgi:tRNA dimethylallyltransferase
LKKIVLIVGPTAVGKTALSIALAKALNAEVISGDSMQVYRKLDIGTAKVTPEEMAGVPHHLINVADVQERYTVADFQQQASQAIDKIDERGRLPLVVGGTGFYLQGLVQNLSLGADNFDQRSRAIREHWQQVADEKGPAFVWHHLNEIDPKAAGKIPVNNVRRSIRAIEVIEKTGKLFSEQEKPKPVYDYLTIGLTTDRQLLYQRINQRVDLMMKQGLLDEARWLYEQGGLDLPAGKGIGYRELDPYFAGEQSLSSCVDKIKQDSRHYAKRQLTWFRHHLNTHWYDLVTGKNSAEEIEDVIRTWLTKERKAN